MNIKLTEAQKIKVLNTEDLYRVMQEILLRENKIDRNKEHFWLVCMANNNRILMIELISLGSVNATIVEPMDVFSFALQKRAVKLIMVHNHPSGEMKPSKNDREITDKMMAIGKFVKVPIVDHLIISEKKYYSFMAEGMMDEIEKNTTFDLTFKNIQKLKTQMKGAANKKAVEMAKRMLKDKKPLAEISKYTGLTKKQVEALQK
jgi:DNA repair protein RadC